jgi:hypothetical protein
MVPAFKNHNNAHLDTRLADPRLHSHPLSRAQLQQ